MFYLKPLPQIQFLKCKSTILYETENRKQRVYDVLKNCFYLCIMDKNEFKGSQRVGILGGGQLGRMFIQSAISFDVSVEILENSLDAPCAEIANSFTLGDINDFESVYNFGKNLNILTVEIENVNIEALYKLESEGVKVYPQPRVLELIKDKGIQKQFYIDHNIPTAPFELIVANPDKNLLTEKIPFVQKLRTGGYDGKGVQVIKTKSDAKDLFEAPSLIEELIPFEKELSIIVARNENGEKSVFPSVECEFNDANLVEFLFSPAEINSSIENEAKKIAMQIIDSLEMVGILAVEFFLTKEGTLLVNEIAPRPHNSGHHTIECNVTSQFEQHLRTVMNFPMGDTSAIQKGAMINLIGEPGHNGLVNYQGLTEVLSLKSTHVHLYGKKTTKPFRKMGHITVCGENMKDVKLNAKNILKQIRVISHS
jgi:5-(carboxyamino)imidazole ribonucleotide synthase